MECRSDHKRGCFLSSAAQYPHPLNLATYNKSTESPAIKSSSRREKKHLCRPQWWNRKNTGPHLWWSECEFWSRLTRHGIVNLGSWKCGSISIPQRISGPSQYPLHFNMHFSKIPRWSVRKSDMGKLLDITFHMWINAPRELGTLPSTQHGYVSATNHITVMMLACSFYPQRFLYKITHSICHLMHLKVQRSL